MKTIIRLLFFASSIVGLKAQTNTFPTSGNVGIGTISPAVKLDILDSSAVQTQPLRLFNQYGADFKGVGIAFAGGNGNWASIYGAQQVAGTWDQGRMIFKTRTSDVLGDQEKMTILANGNVGIGTAVPVAPLTIQSSAALPAGSPSLVLEGEYNTERIQIRSVGGDAVFGAFQSGGNMSAPTALSNGSNAGYYQLGGYDGTGWTRGAWMQGRAAEAWTATNHGTHLIFSTTPNGASGAMTERVRITEVGNVGIGTTNPTQKLSVNGTIRAKEVIVDTGWSDYVFAPDYRLAPLSEVEQHIKAEGHLPGIPSAAEVADHGITVGDMQSRLLAKIEELTLHQIEQEKRNSALQVEIATLKREVAVLRSSESK